jgi:hypothetical protein
MQLADAVDPAARAVFAELVPAAKPAVSTAMVAALALKRRQ